MSVVGSTADATSPADLWGEVLHRLEVELAAAESALAAGDLPALPTLTTFAPPVGLPPLPPIHRVRAERVADRQRRVEDGVAERLAAVGRALTASATGPGPTPAPRRSSRFDTHA